MAHFLLGYVQTLLMPVVHINHHLSCYCVCVIAYGYQARFHPEQLESDVNMTVHKALSFSLKLHAVAAEAAPIYMSHKFLQRLFFNSNPSTTQSRINRQVKIHEKAVRHVGQDKQSNKQIGYGHP